MVVRTRGIRCGAWVVQGIAWPLSRFGEDFFEVLLLLPKDVQINVSLVAPVEVGVVAEVLDGINHPIGK
jgi:hypothetical protein